MRWHMPLGYSKFIVSALATAVYALQAALSDGHVTGQEWRGIVFGAAGSVLVLLVPNRQIPAVPPEPPL